MTRNPSPDEIADLYRDMESGPSTMAVTARRRLCPDLTPLDINLEVRFPERLRAITVRTAAGRHDGELLVAAGVRCHSRRDTIEVTAEPNVDGHMFCTLVADLVYHLIANPTRPTAALVARIRAWQRMLAAGLATGMSPEARLGLVGELLVLHDLVAPACPDIAVQAWIGPTRAPRDFSVDDTAVEVKTVSHREPDRCQISNERQLDTDDLGSLYLAHQSIRVSAQHGASLPELVDAARADPALSGQQVLLEERLLHAGWLDIHRRQYEQERYSLAIRRCYLVTDGFPRITPTSLPIGITGVSYGLDLAACQPHFVGEHLVRHALTDAWKRIQP
ncbi:PD-(D/E)XK motif protein [Micromonospora sp. NPDC049048]|uniref:PD-(D/E)XK motif protein n=1 Tax=Micromonospora sp. NPDC049048 TaxID=3364263 RepID=UPI003711F6FB